MNNLEQLKGAFKLVGKFDTLEDDDTIDKLICYAINSGLDISQYDIIDKEEYIETYA